MDNLEQFVGMRREEFDNKEPAKWVLNKIVSKMSIEKLINDLINS